MKILKLGKRDPMQGAAWRHVLSHQQFLTLD